MNSERRNPCIPEEDEVARELREAQLALEAANEENARLEEIISQQQEEISRLRGEDTPEVEGECVFYLDDDPSKLAPITEPTTFGNGGTDRDDGTFLLHEDGTETRLGN